MRPDPKQLEKLCEYCDYQGTNECPNDLSECSRFDYIVRLEYHETYPSINGVSL